jgi:biopolymer transport protein ExbD
MARRYRLELEAQDEPKLDVASLIDVSFLLLIYFLVTTTLQKRETDLGLKLPADTPTETPFKIDPVTIKVDVEGQVFVNKELVEDANTSHRLPTLVSRLRDFKKLADSTDQKPVVIVAADDDARQQRFVDVMNALAAVEITSVTLTGFRSD